MRPQPRRTEAGLVDEDDFDPQRLGRTAADLLAELFGGVALSTKSWSSPTAISPWAMC
ncbi:MAG: hypothetical protein IPL28_11355 [Chloroflexi bacterium]|nr:hypothetical protein [Chloroflexota bacterium]